MGLSFPQNVLLAVRAMRAQVAGVTADGSASVLRSASPQPEHEGDHPDGTARTAPPKAETTQPLNRLRRARRWFRILFAVPGFLLGLGGIALSFFDPLPGIFLALGGPLVLFVLYRLSTATYDEQKKKHGRTGPCN